MQKIIIKIKQKSLQLQASNVDTWWNLIRNMFQTYLQILFDEHKADEASSKRRLEAYKEKYPKFKYISPFVTPEDNFNTSNFNQDEVSPKWRRSRSLINLTYRFEGRRYYIGGYGWTDHNTSWRACFKRSFNRNKSTTGICSHISCQTMLQLQKFL